jgi:hypothetical protein
MRLLRKSGPGWKLQKTYFAKLLKLSIEAHLIKPSLSNRAKIAR